MITTRFQLNHPFVMPLAMIALLVAFESPTPAQAPSTGQPGASSHMLEPAPLVTDSLGLKINLPLGSEVLSERVNGNLVITVSDAQTDPKTGLRTTPTWSMRIQQMMSTASNPTAALHVDDLLRDFNLNRQSYKVIANQPVTYSGVPGQLCYLEMATPQGQPYTAGWLILPTGGQSFMVFSIQTLPEHLAKLRPVLETSFATIELRNSEELASDRKSRLDAGKAILESATPEKLQSLVGLNNWYRIYTANADGTTTERGYSRLQVLDGMKGALDPKKKENKYTPDDRKSGMMIRVEGRVVINAERGVYYDSVGLYWMAWDQSEEAWSILGTHRQGDAEQSEAETAVRMPATAGKPIATLNVIKSDNATNSREPFNWEVPDAYLSQPIHWALAKLLPHTIKTKQEFSFYFYNLSGGLPQLSQRTDVWEPVGDGSGNLKLMTKMTADTRPITSTYDREGTLIRRVHADGSITEPTTPDALRKLWKSKGLNVGKSG